MSPRFYDIGRRELYWIELLYKDRLALFLGLLYGLVRFVKWAWER